MSIDWDSLKDFKDWSGALRGLLDEAREALKADDIGRRVAAQEQLNAFIDHSPNAVAGKLDEIAGQAIDDLFAGTLQEALASIGKRTAELARYTKEVGAAAADAHRDAASIRLDTARGAVDAITEAIQAMSALRTSLGTDASDEALMKEIDRAIAAVQKLRNMAEAVRPPEGAASP